MAINRIKLLGIPVDVCPPEDIESQILEILAKPGTNQIVFLSIWDLLKAKNKKSNFKQCLESADLILPISKSILMGAKFLKLNVPIRYNPFSATISILSIMEQHYKSLYLLGSHKKALMQAEKNIRETFPNLQIVGRYVGYYDKNVENNIVQAIYKSSPSLVLISDGIKEKNLWAYNRRNSFATSIFMYYKDSIGIFSDRIRGVKEETFNKGLEIWVQIFHNPLRIFLIFPFMRYLLLLTWYKIFKKK